MKGITMKRMLCILALGALCACDRPTSDAEFVCKLFPDWQNAAPAVLTTQEYKDKDKERTDVDVHIKTYDDYAAITVNGQTAYFPKDTERRTYGIFGYAEIDYSGTFPGTTRDAKLSIYADISDKKVLQYNILFRDDKFIYERDGREMGINHTCTPVKPEYRDTMWGASVPFNHHYKMPNKTERCINEIVKIVRCNSSKCDTLFLVPEESPLPILLSAEEALSLSPNWDYKNMKLYANDGPLQDYEKDACDTLQRVKDFIKSKQSE